jgi:hypothetical protein
VNGGSQAVREGVVGSDGADSMFRFWLERGGDGMKCCRKKKRMQRARLGSMGRKRDTSRHVWR